MGYNSAKFSQILWKVNQVMYIMYPNCMPGIMILAQGVIQLFCSQGCFTLKHKMPKSEMGDNSVKYLQKFAKS